MMSSNNNEWVIVGRFGRVHGLKGFISVQSFTEPRNNIVNYDNWHIKQGNQWHLLKLLQIEVNDKHVLVRVDGYQEREHLATLTNAEIAVPRDQLPALDEDEFYWHQLIGLNVVNTEGEAFGVVEEMMSTGSNDVLVVQGDKRRLIPYLPGLYVTKVDLNNQQIIVDWDKAF